MKHLHETGDVETETFLKLVDYREIAAFPYYGFWSEMDSVKDIQDAENQAENHLKVLQNG